MSVEQQEDNNEITIKLTGNSADRFVRLMEVCETEDGEEVMKNALRLFEDAIKEHQAGRKLYLKPGKGKFTEYKVFG